MASFLVAVPTLILLHCDIVVRYSSLLYESMLVKAEEPLMSSIEEYTIRTTNYTLSFGGR